MRVRVVLLILSLAVMALSQPQQQVVVNPDCMIPFQFTATGQVAPANANSAFNNKQVGCNVWQIQYANTGFATVTLTLQSAPDNAGVPGAWGTMGGSLLFGVNPNTSTTQASTLLNTFGTTFPAWVRVLVATTGSGQVTGVAFGIRQAGSGGIVSLSATSVGISSPLGQTSMAGGVSVTLPSNQLSGCAKAIVNLSGSGNTQIVALSGTTKIYICDMEFSTGTPEDFKLTEGTGVNCVTGAADVTALMKNISAWSLTPAGAFAAAAGTATGGDELCANQANAQAAAVTIWYIQQ